MSHEVMTRSRPPRVLQALELFGPQARPYNFDDHFDCWGLVRRVFDWLDDGFDMDQEARGRDDGGQLAADRAPRRAGARRPAGDPSAARSRRIHVVFSCGRVGGHDLVYDSSSRGLVPLFDERGRAGGRPCDPHQVRARHRDDRPPARRRRGVPAPLGRPHALLPQGAARAAAGRRRGARARPGRAAPRRRPRRPARSTAAGVFPATRGAARSTTTRPRATSTTTCPTARPCRTTCYEALVERGDRAGLAERPPAPVIVATPGWGVAHGPLTVSWRYPNAAAGERLPHRALGGDLGPVATPAGASRLGRRR